MTQSNFLQFSERFALDTFGTHDLDGNRVASDVELESVSLSSRFQSKKWKLPRSIWQNLNLLKKAPMGGQTGRNVASMPIRSIYSP